LALLPGVGFATQLYSLDTPAYVPSNTVVADPGACAATGIADPRDAIINPARRLDADLALALPLVGMANPWQLPRYG